MSNPNDTKAATPTAAAATATATPLPYKDPVMDTKARADAASPPYEDFEPLCGWRKEEGQDTLVVHLPEFRREQLKVSVSSRGTLKITGERPMVDDKSKSSRFTKKIEIPKDCSTSEINAKFTIAGLLYISMPKQKTPLSATTTKQDQPPTPTTVQENQPQQKPPATQDRKLTVNVMTAVAVAAVAIAVAVALGAYVTHKCRSSGSSW